MAEIDNIIEILRRLPRDKQRLVGEIVGSWADEVGMDIAFSCAPPADNIDKWVTKMKMESKSPRTIEMYRYYASKFLEACPRPTRLEAQKYLGRPA